MPRILRIINRLNLGGPTHNVALLSKYLQPEYETLLLSGMREDDEASSEHILNDLCIQPQYIGNMYRSINPLKDLPAYREIKKIIKDFKPDIVHTHAAKPGALGRLAAYESGVKAIVHTYHGHVFHSYFTPYKTQFYIQLERFLSKITHKVIALSQQQKYELTHQFNICKPNKIEIVPLGFDLNKFQTNIAEKRQLFRQEYNISDQEIAIAIVGRLVPIKNHALFINALKQVLELTNKKIRAFIVGDGEERNNLEQLAQQANISVSTSPQNAAALTFTSWITDIDRVYAGIDIVALSSLNEGTPVSLIEAQSANKPIVSTQVGGVQDVVIPNVTALLSPSKHTNHFAKNLIQLIENEALRGDMGKNGYHFVQNQYSYGRLVNDVNKLYRRILHPQTQNLALNPALNAHELEMINTFSKNAISKL